MSRPPGRRGGGGRGPKVSRGGGRGGRGGGLKSTGCLVLAIVGSSVMISSGLVGILAAVTR